MATQQERMVRQVEARIADAGFETTVSTGWSNQVTIRAFDPDATEQLFHVYLDFQDTYVTGGVFLEGDDNINNSPYRRVPGGGSERVDDRSFLARYAEAATVRRLFSVVDVQVGRSAREARGRSASKEFEDVLDSIVEDMPPSRSVDVVAEALRKFAASRPGAAAALSDFLVAERDSQPGGPRLG